MRQVKLFLKSAIFFCSLCWGAGVLATTYGSETAVSVEPHRTFSGAGNSMLGFGWFKNGFTLSDASTTCTFNSAYPVSGTVDMNGGALYLLDDLLFKNATTLKSFGDVYGSDHTLDFCASITGLAGVDDIIKDTDLVLHADLVINSTLRVQGSCSINAEFHSLILGSEAEIIVESGASLTLRNCSLENVRTERIYCADNIACIVLDRVRWVQDDHYLFSQGSLSFSDCNDFVGSYSFVYDSAQTSTIQKGATWHITDDMRLCIGRKDAGGAEPLQLVDATACLLLHNCSLLVTASGMQLANGTVLSDGSVTVDVDSTSTHNGLHLGNGQAADDIVFELNPGATVRFAGGHVTYDVLDPNRLRSRSATAEIVRDAASVFYIKQNLTLSKLVLNVSPLSTMTIDPGKLVDYVDCDVDFGTVSFTLSARQHGDFLYTFDGNDVLSIHYGLFPVPLSVSGVGNQIQGTGCIVAPITLQDSGAKLDIGLVGTILDTIYLNGGTLSLSGDISFGLDKLLSGSGHINLNNHSLSFCVQEIVLADPISWEGNGAMIELNSNVLLENDFTFSGLCIINGNGNTLSLGTNGGLIVEDNSTLVLKNIRVEDIAGYQIRCKNDSSQLVLADMAWIQDGNFTFTVGSFSFTDNVELLSSNTFGTQFSFSYESLKTSTVSAKSILHVTDGLKMNVGVQPGGEEPLLLFNNTSVLHLDNCTFCVTGAGMRLICGVLLCDRDVTVDISSTDTTNGLFLGDGTIAHRLEVDINPGAVIDFVNGHVVYDVPVTNGLISRSTSSILKRGAANTFFVANDMTLDNLTIDAHPLAPLIVQDGKTLRFENCIIKSSQGEFLLNATRQNVATQRLAGGDSLLMRFGMQPFALEVDGVGNSIMGNGCLTGPITLLDGATELTIGFVGLLMNSITLGGGTVTLNGDLDFGLDNHLLGNGLVDMATFRLNLGAKDFVWTATVCFHGDSAVINLNSNVQLTSCLTFTGNCIIDGNGNTLNFDTTGQIDIEDDASLTFKNIRLEDISGTQLRCKTDTSRIVLDNVEWLQDGAYTFTKGSILFEHNVEFLGTHTFTYESSQTSTIAAKARWHIRDGMRLQLGRLTPSAVEPLVMEDETAVWHLDNMTFHVINSGLTVAEGTIEFDKVVNLEIDSTDTTNGLMIGTGMPGETLRFDINPGAVLNFVKGHFSYNLAAQNKLRSRSITAKMVRGPGTVFNLMQSIDVENIQLDVDPTSVTLEEPGKDTFFIDTHFKLPIGEFLLTGKRFDFSSNLLPGDGSLFLFEGTMPLGTLVSGVNNIIKGNGNLTAPVVLLAPTAEVTFNLDGALSANVTLNGGTAKLDRDLYFVGNAYPAGGGMLDVGAHSIVLGQKDLTWIGSTFWSSDGPSLIMNANVTLNSAWTFSGDCLIQGNGNEITLGTNGAIIVEDGSTLELRNVVLEDLSGTQLRAVGATSKIVLNNTHLDLDGDYTFTQGAFEIAGEVLVGGDAAFVYQSSQTSSILPRSRLILDDGFTFSYDPSDAVSQDLLAFADATSVLHLHGARFHATRVGAQLTGGTLLVTKDSFISSESFVETDTMGGQALIDRGVIFGNGTASGDLTCVIGPGGDLELDAGSLAYRNVLASSWRPSSNTAALHIKNAARLKLYQNLPLGRGLLYGHDGAHIARAPGKSVTGSIIPLGRVFYERL